MLAVLNVVGAAVAAAAGGREQLDLPRITGFPSSPAPFVLMCDPPPPAGTAETSTGSPFDNKNFLT